MPSKSKPATENKPTYLGDRERSAIESWNRSVNSKSTTSKANEKDADVQAYLQAKMALYQKASSVGK